jgi:hypothetical protein
LCALAAAPTYAETHGKGLFVRGTAGLNSGGSSIDADVPDSGTKQLSGVGADFSAAVGWTIAPNFAVHGTFLAWGISDPAIGRNQGKAEGTTFTMGAFGAGATFYMMPTNMYFTLSLSAATLRLKDDTAGDFDTGTGFAMEFGVGKEWLLGNKFGIGPSGALVYHSIPNGGDIPNNWSGLQLSIRLSATFN